MIIPSITHLRAFMVRSATADVEVGGTPSSTSNLCNDINNRRTLFQIVWSCLSVLIACTWVSVHPNVPGPNESSWKVLRRKIGLMVIALIAPEILVLWAARQWFAARKLSKGYKGWTKSHAFFALMGGFAVYRGEDCIAALRFIPQGCRYTPMEKTILENFPNPDTETKHASATGYAAVDRDDHSDRKFHDHSFAAHVDLIRSMKEYEIKDRSHSDGFSKLIAVMQTTWFVVQLFTRWAEGLAVTELEVMTLAFAAMNVLIYFFWWDKPQGVGCPVCIQQGSTNTGKIALTEQNEGWIASEWRWLQNIFRNALDAVSRFWKQSHEDILLDTFSFLGLIIKVPYHLADITVELIMGDNPNIGEPTAVSSFERTLQLEPANVMDKFIAYGAAVMFGAIHCAAWTSRFPTTAEEILWKVCSLLVTCAPIYLGLFDVITDMVVDLQNSWRIRFLAVLYMIAVFFYILARLSLIVQPFVALRSLPPGVFEDIQWINAIPHI
ncbi:hypothetical protein GYMLUDRAFT_49111 [Collybiopsis luxurians FD-317 M1]|uniref:Uncharacterized protein n=1 Tax=Collybiopsis luxurians FD-317 M1 TaxID=944289 RepID=A0A0D0CG86_9AGAR|nr:hypothetical protein GYMLUDRAFT_49111 [Collybiopsis luxurians FD-317 M1]